LSSDAISPIDGRYRAEAEPLVRYFSERALNEERLRVELDYLRLLVELGVAPRKRIPRLSPSDRRLHELEERLGHDVKAAETLIRESLEGAGAGDLGPYVHLGLTSEDTNSLAFARLLRRALIEVLIPYYSSLVIVLARLARNEASTVMLARTHGVPAVPTTFGKEISVFAVRMAERVATLKALKPMAKFSGAVGTYASFSLLAKRNWPELLGRFVEESGVDYTAYSTQVVPGERLSDILHCVINLNQLALSLARDLWLYQALGRLRFVRPGKVSSSTMPQKVNPVDLENAEGQAEISNSILSLLAYRLQVTRLQRDLSDSVIRRMTGQGLAHSLVAFVRLRSSLSSLKIDRKAMVRELDAHPEVMAEAAQITLRLRGDTRGYEKVKVAVEKGRFAPFPRKLGPTGYLGDAPRLAGECPKVVARLLSSSS
jgi:adenylosuccinate lyase